MKNRRKILKKISTATLWTTPAIQSIVVPSHAQTSNEQASCPEVLELSARVVPNSGQLRNGDPISFEIFYSLDTGSPTSIVIDITSEPTEIFELEEVESNVDPLDNLTFVGRVFQSDLTSPIQLTEARIRLSTLCSDSSMNM